jgi:hypothetical protein
LAGVVDSGGGLDRPAAAAVDQAVEIGNSAVRVKKPVLSLAVAGAVVSN